MFKLSHRRPLAGVAAAGALACALSFSLSGLALADDPNNDVSVTANSSTDGVILTLSQAPLASSAKVDRIGKKVNVTGVKSKGVRSGLSQQRSALKKWMKTNAPKATITNEYDFALNGVAVTLNGTDPAVFAQAPGVTNVSPQVMVTRAAEDPDLKLINAPAGWTASGATSTAGSPSTWAGHGIKVGVIDSGIDANHPCFDDAGFPVTAQRGDARFTNNKVIVAKVFNSNTSYTAEGIGAHGTHVAGTVACNLNTPATAGGADIPYTPSGVAPGAQLGNYNVFPNDIDGASSSDIIAAMNAAAADGMDVLNMSLGSQALGGTDAYTSVVANLDKAGIVVAVAQGNDGPGYGTAGSPGNAAQSLTSGASSVGHFIGTPILSSGAQLTVAATGEFALPNSNLTAALGVVSNADGSLGQACSALPTGSLNGKIALVARGTCSFGNKVSNAQNAGAVAAIVVNNSPGDPLAMAADELYPTRIPAVMVAQSDQQALVALNGQAVTLATGNAYKFTGNANILMDFSSWGPVPGNYAAKPDLVSPGGNVLSAYPQKACASDPNVATNGCWGLMSGTSMASPHTAGMAAVVKAAHPNWTAAQIRSAIANTATIDGVKQTAAITTVESDVLKVGNGLGNLNAAVNASIAVSETTASFGLVTKGKAKSKTLTLTNLTSSPITVPVSITKANVSGFRVNTSSVTLPANGTAQVTVTATIPRTAGNYNQAHLALGDRAHVVLFAYAR